MSETIALCDVFMVLKSVNKTTGVIVTGFFFSLSSELSSASRLSFLSCFSWAFVISHNITCMHAGNEVFNEWVQHM